MITGPFPSPCKDMKCRLLQTMMSRMGKSTCQIPPQDTEENEALLWVDTGSALCGRALLWAEGPERSEGHHRGRTEGEGLQEKERARENKPREKRLGPFQSCGPWSGHTAELKGRTRLETSRCRPPPPLSTGWTQEDPARITPQGPHHPARHKSWS